MAAVDQDRQLDARRAAEVHHGVEGAADGAARVEDVIDQHDALAVDVERDVRGVDLGREMGLEIVAVEADVEASERDVHPLDLADPVDELLGEQVAAGDDAHDGQVLASLVALEDLVRDARHRTRDGCLVHDDGLG